MLILDHMHHRMHNNLPDETQLPNGQVRYSCSCCFCFCSYVHFYFCSYSYPSLQKFELISLALLGVPSMAEKFLEISDNLKQLNFDQADYVCLKFILLLNAGKGLCSNSCYYFFSRFYSYF